MASDRSRVLLALLVLTTLAFVARHDPAPGARPSAEAQEGGPYPSDWFGAQRAYPSGVIDQAAYRAAVEQARVERAGGAGIGAQGALIWEMAGPYNIGGRVTALAVAPGGNTVYLGAAAGGVFKSTNGGVNWAPVSDAIGTFSVGALALEPGNPSVVYCGTGEANSSVDSYDGSGLYRSLDAGGTWSHLGLTETRRIGRVAVDPSNPQRIFVAAMGAQFSTGPDRGLYRSENGGASWTKVLFVNDSTGACDVVVNPAHPETVFAATWERVRRSTYRRAFGPGCGIWRSANFGATWTRLTNGLPPPSDNVGRIGLAMAASRPALLYAQIVTGSAAGYVGLGMYRTTDGGISWTRRDASGFTGAFGGFAWYFGEVAVDPTVPDRVFGMGVSVIRSTDGGINFANFTSNAHVDQHAMWIDPSNPARIYLGNDGGFFSSINGGASWAKSTDLPITQFYAGAIDPSSPGRLMGGTQDNNTLITNGVPTAWSAVLGGDGFQCLIDPLNPQVLFAEYQNCSGGQGLQRSTNGGASFALPTGFVLSDRYNWSTPIVMNPLNHNTLLVGSQRVYKSLNNGIAYAPISGDLSRNLPTQLLYGTLTTLDISAADSSVYYAGTDDGRVWRSTDAGGNWTEITAGLPLRWVTRVTADPVDPQVVYVTLSGFGQDELASHVYRSADRGDTWTPISGNLPDIPANDILVDPVAPNRLFLATDVGVYVSNNLGAEWEPLGSGMPIQTIFDLTLHNGSRTLVAATHGRSQWRLDLAGLPVLAVEPAPAPGRLALSSPAPNPSHASVALSLVLESPGAVQVAVFDPMGRRLRDLERGPLAAGRHAITWDGRDASGRPAAAGVYYVRARVGSGASVVRRLVRTR